MDTTPQPDIERLVSCTERMAGAMKQQAVDGAETRPFLKRLLFDSNSDGGKDVWASVQAGLITEIEARNLVMAHCATWLSHRNGVSEPSFDLWGSDELELMFEQALYGRAAKKTDWDRKMLNEGIAFSFLRWFCGDESRFDPQRQLAADVKAELMFAGRTETRQELVKVVEMTGKSLELRVLRQVSDGTESVFVYECVDEVTNLKHRAALAVRVSDGLVVDVMRVVSQGWPEQLP